MTADIEPFEEMVKMKGDRFAFVLCLDLSLCDTNTRGCWESSALLCADFTFIGKSVIGKSVCLLVPLRHSETIQSVGCLSVACLQVIHLWEH